jgi:ABC-type sugar transport system ATPase subunit
MSIALEGISKRFGEKSVLREITHTFDAGSLTALVGPSGCGKTTLLRVIAGLERPNAGRVLFDNVDVTDAPLGERHVGFVYQQYALFPHLTVADNIGFGLAVRKKKRSDVSTRVTELLDLVRLSGYERRLPRELSGGERQRTCGGICVAGCASCTSASTSLRCSSRTMPTKRWRLPISSSLCARAACSSPAHRRTCTRNLRTRS